MPKSKPIREKVVAVREVKCYLLNPAGDTHRIAMLNTGRQVMMDHTWESAKLLRAMTHPHSCCIGAITGTSAAGRTHIRAFPHIGKLDSNKAARLVSSPPTNYLHEKLHSVHASIDTCTNLRRCSPYAGRTEVVAIFTSGGGACRAPQWYSFPHNKVGGQLRIFSTVANAVAVHMNMTVMEHSYPLKREGNSYSVLPLTAYVPPSMPVFKPYILDQKIGTVYMVHGLLVDPDIYNLPRRVRFARACITPNGVTILDIQEIGQ